MSPDAVAIIAALQDVGNALVGVGLAIIFAVTWKG